MKEKTPKSSNLLPSGLSPAPNHAPVSRTDFRSITACPVLCVTGPRLHQLLTYPCTTTSSHTPCLSIFPLHTPAFWDADCHNHLQAWVPGMHKAGVRTAVSVRACQRGSAFACGSLCPSVLLAALPCVRLFHVPPEPQPSHYTRERGAHKHAGCVGVRAALHTCANPGCGHTLLCK